MLRPGALVALQGDPRNALCDDASEPTRALRWDKQFQLESPICSSQLSVRRVAAVGLQKVKGASSHACPPDQPQAVAPRGRDLRRPDVAAPRDGELTTLRAPCVRGCAAA